MCWCDCFQEVNVLKENNYTVYIHIFPDKKVYVGLTKQKVNRRWGKDGTQYKKQPVYKAILKYGWDNIEHVVVKENLDIDEARFLEKRLIKKYDSINNGYNSAKGGGCGGNPWTQILYNGKLYYPDELAELSDVDGLTGHDVTTRLGHGWSVEKIIKTPKTNKNIKYKYNGSEYTSKELYSLFCKSDISLGTFRGRLSQGWDIDRALSQPENTKVQPLGCRDKKRERLFEYNGKIYKSHELLELSPIEDLTVANLVNRICQRKWDIDKALTTPKKRFNQKFEYNGIMYTSKELAQMSPHDNITPRDITERINRTHWSVEDAIFKPKQLKH